MKQFRNTKYNVTLGGDIFNTHTNKTIKQSTDKDGYKKCTIFTDGNKKRNTFFCPQDSSRSLLQKLSYKFQVNHKDGNKQNNAYYNLEWVTCQENVRHAWDTGLKHKNYSQEQLNDINRKATNNRYSNMSDIQKEENGLLKEKNPAYNMNYNKNKTLEQLEEIKRRKQETCKKNKGNHLYKGGNPIIVNGKKYKSINQMAKEESLSFKYIKRRLESKDYLYWNYISTQGGIPNEN